MLFTQEFFKSTWCCQELEIVLELRKREGRPYLPVFLGLTADEVFKEARSIHGVQFANEVGCQGTMYHGRSLHASRPVPIKLLGGGPP